MAERPLTGNAADPEQVASAKKHVKLRRSQELRDLREVLAGPGGRRVIWKLLGDCGVFRSSFNTNGSVVFFNEGMRQIGLVLMADVMEADEGAYSRMASEARKEAEAL